jgi:protein-disulfide isomerase
MSKPKKKLMPTVAAILSLSVVAGVAVNTMNGFTGSAYNAVVNPESVDTSHIKEMSIGKADAPVTMVEYSSYTCIHCANFHKETLPELKRDFVDSGKVRLVTREVYMDEIGLWASIVARCGGSENFHQISDEIFKEQTTWASQSDSLSILEFFRNTAKAHGTSDEQLNACLSDEDQALALVAYSNQSSVKDKVRGTPTFVINGRLVQNQPYEKLKQVLENEFKEATE